MIELSNGYKFEFVAASGALAYDGRGWPWEIFLSWAKIINTKNMLVVSKTVTLEPRKGNFCWYKPFNTVRLIPGGIVNAIGLTNPGFDWWCENIGKKAKSSHTSLAASIAGEPEEIAEMAKRLSFFNLVAVEINASCPNANQDLTANDEQTVLSCVKAKENTCLPIILKLSVIQKIEDILPYLDGVIDAVSINSIPWRYIFPYEKIIPLAKFGGGGVSGVVTQTYSWEMISRIRKISDIPIIASAIWNYQDLEYTEFFGANAFAFGSIFLLRPWRPKMIMKKYFKERGVK